LFVPPLFKSPNCVVCGASLALYCLDKNFGLKEVHLVTFQALSGRGDAKYTPANFVVGNVLPLAGSSEKTDDYQRAELLRLFPKLQKCTVHAHRVSVQNGHYLRLNCTLASPPASVSAVKAQLENFRPLNHLDLPTAPTRPIVLCDDVGRPAPAFDAHHHNGMAIAIGDISLSGCDLSFGLVVNNLVRGAWGAALLSAELYHKLHQQGEAEETTNRRDTDLARGKETSDHDDNKKPSS